MSICCATLLLSQLVGPACVCTHDRVTREVGRVGLVGPRATRPLLISNGDEPQMLIRGDNCCRNNCCSTGKLLEFTQYSYIDIMRVVGVVDSE